MKKIDNRGCKYNINNSNTSRINSALPMDKQFKLENGIYYCQGY